MYMTLKTYNYLFVKIKQFIVGVVLIPKYTKAFMLCYLK